MNAHTITSDVSPLKVPRAVAALIRALHLREPDIASLAQLEDHEWGSLLAFCDLGHLTLSLAQLPKDGFPSWVVERLKTNVADNALRFERVKATYREAAEALDRAGVNHVVIKGFTQAPDYVEDPRLRAQSDLDLYCPPEMIKSARIALQGIGYTPNDQQSYTYADHDRTMNRMGDWRWRENSFDPEMPLSIELHFCLWNRSVSYFHVAAIDRFWDRRTMRAIDGFTFTSLSPVDNLGYLALHILRNIFLRDTILHHVYELAIFLHRRAEDDTFWAAWSETHDATLQSCEAIAFYYARSLFGCNLNPHVLKAIESLPSLQRQWLRRFAMSSIEDMSHMNKDFLWLHMSFLKSPMAKLKLLKRTLIPTHFARMNTPLVRMVSDRATQSRELHPYLQYFVYLVSRFASHSCASVDTIGRGLYWRMSKLQLVRQIRIFLAASFF
ncbi:putative nucleotidyltransferase-like protein [Edaphobacter aggregans]|uniref:Putative nucleotidyltransferase-like protein n=1 Tax=Edaphobacter aggregans TaxID=570835 RepID=A0A428MET4_9BACT|nr:nucleotidyltransferase family protein [Edaphobacter aggregans]RSL15390.1 putative nucleotidyltransferase-like protein [Edaphobacter aggregans]